MMKKRNLFSLLFLVLSFVINAQVSNILPFENTKNIYKYGDFYACVYDYADGNSKGKIFDNTGNQVGSDYIFNKYTSSGDTNTSHILFDNNYVYIIGTVKPSASGGSWNKISKYNKANSTLIEEKLVRGITLKPKLISGILYLDIKLTPNYDFLSSGWDSVISYHGGSEEHNITTFDNPTWASYLGDFSNSITDITETADGNIAVATNSNAWKINASTGDIISTIVTGDEAIYNRITDKNECVNHSDPHIEVKKWDGTTSAQTDFQDFNIYDWDAIALKSYSNYDLVITSQGIGKPVFLKRSLSVETQDVIHAFSIRVPAMPSSFYLEKILEITETSFTAVAYYSGNPSDFFGTTVPNAGTDTYYVVYTFDFTIDTSQYVQLNDIGSISNSDIVFGINNVVWNNDHFENESNLPVAYVLMSNNLPNVGDDIPTSWNLYNGNGGISFVYKTPIQSNVNGLYMDVLYKDPTGDTTNPISKKYYSLRIFFKDVSIDTIDPNANVLSTYVLELDATGNAHLNPSDIDNGSSDNVGIASMQLDISDFTTADIGVVPVTLTVTDYAGNTDTAICNVTVQNTIGISDNEINHFSVYPNPTNAIFKIKTETSNIQKIEISNTNGQLIFNQNFDNKKEVHVNLSSFQNGIYFVRILDDKDNVSNLKLIKK